MWRWNIIFSEFFPVFFPANHLFTIVAYLSAAWRQPWPGSSFLRHENGTTLLTQHFLFTEKFVSHKIYDLCYRFLKEYAKISGFRSPRRLFFFFTVVPGIYGASLRSLPDFALLVSIILKSFLGFFENLYTLRSVTSPRPAPQYMSWCYDGYVYKNKEKYVRSVSAEKGISPVLVFRQMFLIWVWRKLQNTFYLNVLLL